VAICNHFDALAISPTRPLRQVQSTQVLTSNAKVIGMIVLGDSMLRINRSPIVAFAASSKLPTVYSPRDISGGPPHMWIRF